MPRNKRTANIYPLNSIQTYEVVPSILIEGKWLERMGFKIGQKVNVKIGKNNTIILSVSKPKAT